MDAKLDALQKVSRGVPESDPQTIYIYQATPHSNRGSVKPLEVQRGEELELQLCSHLEKHGAVTGEFNLSLRSKGKQFKPDGNCTVSFVLKPSSEPVRRSNPEPEKPVKPDQVPSVEPFNPFAEIIRRKKELEEVETALYGPADTTPEEPEEEEEEERASLGEIFGDALASESGQVMVVEKVEKISSGLIGLIDAAIDRIRHGVQPKPAANLGRPNTREPAQQRQPATPPAATSSEQQPATVTRIPLAATPKAGTGQ